MRWPWSKPQVVDVVIGRGPGARVARCQLDPANDPPRLWVYVGLDDSLNVANGDPEKENILWH